MPTDESYERVRRDFEELEIETRARFLIEASASTLAKGLEEVGRVLAEGIEDTVRRANRSSERTAPHEPGAAEPETAQQQAPKSGTSSGT
ncbi:MAG: hypothetical protein ABEK84_06620 [Salinibacter sp.]